MNSLILVYALATSSFNLPQGLMSAVCYTESGHNVRAIHKDDGSENSMGICQMHPSTARLVGFRGPDYRLMDPKINIHYAAKYLQHQIIRYNGDVVKAVAAYNAGSYRKAVKGAKNQKYVDKVFLNWASNR